MFVIDEGGEGCLCCCLRRNFVDLPLLMISIRGQIRLIIILFLIMMMTLMMMMMMMMMEGGDPPRHP